MVRVALVGRDFDFSRNDGISRYSFELYGKIVKAKNNFKFDKISVVKRHDLFRALKNLKITDADVVHLMYPNPTVVDKRKAKMVTTWHDNRVFTRVKEKGPFLINYYRARSVRDISIKNYMNSDAIISVSSSAERNLKEYMKMIDLYDDNKKYFVINEGVDEKFLRTKVWKGERKDFGYIGAIDLEHKNLVGLLDVFSRIAEVKNKTRLHIFTLSDNAENILDSKMERFGNLSRENVILHYRATDEEILRYLPKFIAYMQLSHQEGFGLPVIEALAVGTPVFTLSNSVMPREVARCTIRADRDKIVRTAIKMIEKHKPAESSKIRYARSFTWEATAKKTLKVYEELAHL